MSNNSIAGRQIYNGPGPSFRGSFMVDLPTYVIQKKTRCPNCLFKVGVRFSVYSENAPQDVTDIPCDCINGFLYEEVPLTKQLIEEII